MLAALLTGGLLLLARLTRLGFLANFLSRTVLVGFLTGVGVQVAVGEVPEMLGLDVSASGTFDRLVATVQGLSSISVVTLAASLIVIAVVVGVRVVARRVPGALIAVVGSIVVSHALDLPAHGVAVLGPVPSGLPSLHLPVLDRASVMALLGMATSLSVVILAQSSATARAYAVRYEESFDEDADLVGLGVANVAAAVTGSFVVNGSPTKTQMVDSAGGRGQLAQLTTSAVVVVVLLFLTGPLAALPLVVLAAIVFVIGVELVDVRGMRRIFAVRPGEFVVAALTATAVVFLGVEQGIVLAIVASVIDHLRHSYAPRDVVFVPSGSGWRVVPAAPGARSAPGVVVYRFGSSLYYANTHQLVAEVTAFLQDGAPLTTLCLDFAAIGDVDYTAAEVLRRLHALLARHGTRLVFSEVTDHVRALLDRFGITALVGADAYVADVADVLRSSNERAPGRRSPVDPRPVSGADDAGSASDPANPGGTV